MSRNKYPEITQKRILDTAMKLFMLKGYDSTTIQDIMNELNISKGGIYHHFSSKEEIMEAVSKMMFEQGIAYIENIAFDKTLTGLQRLQKIITVCLQVTEEKTINNGQSVYLKNPQILTNYLQNTMGNTADMVSDVILVGIKDGTINTMYPHELAQLILLFFNVWLNPWLGSYSSEQLIRIFEFMKTVLEGIDVPLLTQEMFDIVKRLHHEVE